ncbi:MAG: sigma factor-like helix-turn-helix DNA-binding protein [Turicibacter sp.]|nr:sigma factor-like helix-turn-helix DNA-binding protein [Turicibacter sp.]
MRWIDQIKEPDRTYFILKYFQYYETKVIADHFGTTVKAIESSLYRIRK